MTAPATSPTVFRDAPGPKLHFITLILKNLFRRPLRSGLTLSALTTAGASVVALLGIARGFEDSFADVYRSHAVDIVVSRQGAADRLSSSVPESLVTRIRSVDGVRRAGPVLLETLSLEDRGVFGLPAMGLRMNSWMTADYQIDPADAIDGRHDNVVLLGVHLADRVQLRTGDHVDVFDETFTVVGLFRSPSTWENGSMIVPLKRLQSLTGREGQVTYINVVAEANVDPNCPQSQDIRQSLISSIESLDPKLLAMVTEEFVASDTRLKIAGSMAWMTSVIAVLIGAIATLNTMMTSVMERTGEIGILRAIGWPRRRVVGMILCESCGLGLAASLLGVIAALLLTGLLSRLPQAAGLLNPSIGISVILNGVAVGWLIGAIGAILPAWRAAQMMPTQAFGETGSG